MIMLLLLQFQAAKAKTELMNKMKANTTKMKAKMNKMVAREKRRGSEKLAKIKAAHAEVHECV